MIYRMMYTAYCKGEVAVTDLHCPHVTHLAVNTYQNQVFIYIESKEKDLDPAQVVDGDFIPFPDGRRFFRMTEVFHYSAPKSEAHWERKNKREKTPYVRINYLQPEKTASYFFYHYQFQEENPGQYDKYGILFLFGNMLVLYHEKPFTTETDPLLPGLSTHNTPVGKEAWDDMIERHFIPWEEAMVPKLDDGPWLPIPSLIFS